VAIANSGIICEEEQEVSEEEAKKIAYRII